VGRKFNTCNFDFYILDIRKFGRSLIAPQHPNYCKDIREYFEEINITIRQIHESDNGDLFLLGHSMGGLIASNYMNDGQEKDLIKGFILNSPFLISTRLTFRRLSFI
jgi:alpha-beta hydrolase superfamily lysophospholipase